MNAHTVGKWVMYRQPVSTPDDAKKWLCDAVDASVAAGTFQPHMYGVGAGDMATDFGWLIVAQTGCGPTSEANAAFIAAAPDLLASLESLTEVLDGLSCGETADEEAAVVREWHRARAVIDAVRAEVPPSKQTTAGSEFPSEGCVETKEGA